MLAFLIFFSPLSFAAPSDGYGQNYGLLVHQTNEDKIISRAKALSVLMDYFPDAADIDIYDDGSICKLEFLDCTHFYGNRNITQKEFLLWFYYLNKMNSCSDIDDFSADIYNQFWLEARNNNWLTGSDITYKVMEDFLYRYKVSEKFLDHSYYESLVLDEEEINTDNFYDANNIPNLQSDIFQHILELKSIQKRSKYEDKVLDELNSYYLAYKNLEDEIAKLNHPFNVIPELPGYVKENISKYDLREVLGEVSYNYSTNIENRQYNLTHGVSKMNGKIWMPGDVIDFMDILSDNNWWDYKWGWVIINGKSEWLLGGGLCGSATMVFDPSWKAGLQIVKRYPHSLYYDELYPEGSLGLDATIYRGSHKNLEIKNNTDDPIIYYSVDDKEKQEVTLYLIGNSPYKTVEIEGPIQLNKTTFKWIRTMEDKDGNINTEELTTRYGGVY